MKPKLLGEKVPWRIVNETPNMTLIFYEQGNAEMNFVAQFLQFIGQKTVLQEHKVIVEFEDAAKTRTSSKWSDRYPINPDAYDWSEIKLEFHPYKPITDMAKYQQEEAMYMSEWKSSGLCPVANLYQVQDSTWLESLGRAQKHYKHYLFVGEDIYIEVMARNFEWRSDGEVDWSGNSNK